MSKKVLFHLKKPKNYTDGAVPIETVSKLLGHSYLKTTQHYAKLQDEKIGNEYGAISDDDKVNQLLNSKA